MKHILIIDDDVHIINMLYEVLTAEDYKVSRAYSGTEALLLLSNMKPDLILLDLMLPGLSGEEILSQMKGIPVIIISAKVDVDNKVNLLYGGASDYVTKPFDTRELLARIAVQLRQCDTTGNKNVISDEALVTFSTNLIYSFILLIATSTFGYIGFRKKEFK